MFDGQVEPNLIAQITDPSEPLYKKWLDLLLYGVRIRFRCADGPDAGKDFPYLIKDRSVSMQHG